MDWMSIIPPMPITNPATYTIPTTLAVVLYVCIYSSLLGLVMAVFSSQVAVLRPHAASNRPRNEVSILLSKRNVCAPWHKTRQSTKEAPNFLELRQRELRRIPLLGTRVNRARAA